MIFAIDGHISKILSGEKTETRRVVMPGETCAFAFSIGIIGKDAGRVIESAKQRPENAPKEIFSVYTAKGRLKYRAGNDYAVIPKRGQHGIPEARIRLTRIQYSPVWTITPESAQAEGGYTQLEYIRLWASMADKPAVKIIDGMAQFPELGIVELAQELRKRPAHKWHCWHLTFQVVQS